LVTTSLAPSRLIALYTEYSSVTAPSDSSGNSHTTKRKFGPQLPSIKEKGKPASFRRVKIVYSKEPISDHEEASRRLEMNPNDAEANAFLGLEMIRTAEDSGDFDFFPSAGPGVEDSVSDRITGNAIDRLNVAIFSGKLVNVSPLARMLKHYPDKHNAEYWYLLARAHMVRQNYKAVHECLQETVYIQPRCPSFWISCGILFWRINQYRDSLDTFARSIRLHPYHYEAWYNLGVLVGYEVSIPELQMAY